MHGIVHATILEIDIGVRDWGCMRIWMIAALVKTFLKKYMWLVNSY